MRLSERMTSELIREPEPHTRHWVIPHNDALKAAAEWLEHTEDELGVLTLMMQQDIEAKSDDALDRLQIYAARLRQIVEGK